jgi:hypothetical protein
MATNANLKETVPGGNVTLWIELLGPSFLWLCQLETSYGLLPWICAHHYFLLARLSWTPFFAGAVILGVLACRDWMRLCALDPEDRGVARSRFMAALGIIMAALFSLLMLLQGIATFLFSPCLK